MPAAPLALVTGASSGIGEAIARGLARRGHDLVLVARTQQRLDALADDLRSSAGVHVDIMRADLTVPGELADVEQRVAATEHPVDILVNNAGYGSSGPFAELPLEHEVGEIELNVVALVRLTHAALGQMIPRRRGGILNVSSVASFQPAPSSATYAATKAYVTSFTEALHEEVRNQGVKVSALCPGFTRTRFHDRAEMDPRTIPGPLWLDADSVAEAGIDGLEHNRTLVIPGLQYKAIVAMSQYAPRGLLRRAAGIVTSRY